MRAPIAESAHAATQVLTSRLRGLATGVSTRYRARSSAVRSTVGDFNDASDRAKILVKASTVGAGVGIYTGMVLAAMDDSDEGSIDLGPEVDRLIAMSPTLSKSVRELQAGGWMISYGSIDAQGATFAGEKKILINPDGKNDPLLITAILAHETGHATAGPEYTYSPTAPQPGEDYWQWYEKNLYTAYQGESDAGLTTAQVRREILDNNGPDIDNIDDVTKAAYDRYRADDLARPAAVDLLADHLRDHPGVYRDIYGKYLDADWERLTGSPPPDPADLAPPAQLVEADGSFPDTNGPSE